MDSFEKGEPFIRIRVHMSALLRSRREPFIRVRVQVCTRALLRSLREPFILVGSALSEIALDMLLDVYHYPRPERSQKRRQNDSDSDTV